MADNKFPEKVRKKLEKHFTIIYGDESVDECFRRTQLLLTKFSLHHKPNQTFDNVWSHEDQILITYGDMVQPRTGEAVSKLSKLHDFLGKHISGLLSTIHILPFFPSSSDDGFSVVNYRRVDERVGGWDDIHEMSKDFRLMGDLVMNHTSRYSEWFRNYLKGIEPHKDYFIEIDPETDVSMVTRPRSSPLLTPVHTKNGEKFVWSTFSDDQIDVNFANPDVLFEYIDIFFYYVSKGLSVIRLDAVAFIWKELGTECIHLKETHEIVKLIRTLVDHYAPHVTIITETNVPHEENISYFGDGDETHMVYQFSLPPLLVHAILTENATYLNSWAQSLDKLPAQCTYFNFTASHDGIGVRPLQGLIPDHEFGSLIEGMKKKGGFISEKKNPDGSLSPYEINITYFDAFAGGNGSQALQERRYLCSQIISMSLKGVPGIYFHNLTATRNNVKGVSVTGRYRTINRKKWFYDELIDALNDPDTSTYRIFNSMKAVIMKRSKHPAFHPFGGQKVHNISSQLFCIERWDPDNTEHVLVVANLTNDKKTVSLESAGITLKNGKSFSDIISGRECISNGKLELDRFQVVWIKI